MEKFEEELRTRLRAIEPGAEPDDLVRWVKKKVFDSYQNGLVGRTEGRPNFRPVKKSEPQQ